MKHLVALLIKFAMIAIVLFLLWPLLGSAGLIARLWIALWVTGVTYILGDLVILPQTSNVVAVLADGGLTLVTLLIAQLINPIVSIHLVGVIVLSGFVAIGEWFFHKFVRIAVLSP